MDKIHYLTKDSLARLKEELDSMKTEGRKNIAKAIEEAREKGDLKENAEYHAAKEAQGLYEAKIAQLENMLASARIIDKSTIDTSKVSILTTVRILNEKTKKEAVYTLVSEKEADIKTNKLSVDSPIGKGLLGKSVGETAAITTPTGILSFKILHISLEE